MNIQEISKKLEETEEKDALIGYFIMTLKQQQKSVQIVN